MSFNYGSNFTVQIFGQSHSEAIGAVIDGLPAGEAICTEALAAFMARRAPGRSALSTARRETDLPHIISGVLGGLTTGAPICAIIQNSDARSGDYASIAPTPRPGHADWPAFVRSGGHADRRGGGEFSGRMTAPLCFAGGICKQLLARRGVGVLARVQCIAGIEDAPLDWLHPDEALLRAAAQKELAVVDGAAGERMRAAIAEAASCGDSVGGVVECFITGLPVGLGGHMFSGVENRLAQILFGIPAVKGVEFGSGFSGSALRGSQNNDPYRVECGRIVPASNNHGGALGGMTTGAPIRLRVAIKPTPSIALPQRTVDMDAMTEAELRVSGRHDPCIVPRAVAAVEAAAAIAALDLMLDE